MKITTQTFDLFEFVFSLLHRLYSYFFDGKEEDKLSQQDVVDYDFVSGQLGKIILFITQIIYYFDFNKLDPIQTSLLIQGYYIFVIFIVLVESKYIYQGYSYTYHRIIANRLMNIAVNLISLWVIHQDSSLLNIWENIKNLNIEMPEFLIICLVFFTAIEILELLFQLCTRIFSCMKNLDNSQEYDSPGGCGYLCFGQFFGMLVTGGGIILMFYLKNIPLKSLLTTQNIATQSCVGFEFLISFYVYCKRDRKQKEPQKSKKVLCFGYGFCIGTMGIMSGPVILGVIIMYGICRGLCCFYSFKCRCIICCQFAIEQKSHRYQPSNLSANTNED
ncbi:unnamed protein product [Paramecium primaurelia]|uniref:Transmembrane protein n=1 Tax=Paramecium primaurelia TaxID=5886 RepID=A0A8S1QFF1_PARPR|nr:unnamed protein product [Paramecium primaurelia]